MLAVSKSTLKVVSGLVWFSGAIILLLKGASLFAQAIALRPGELWSWLSVAVAILIGGAKARYLFGGFCRKNLDRIASLADPQLWQAFRPGVCAFLIAMVISFSALSLRAVVQATIGLVGLVVGLVVLFLLARLATVMRQYRRAFRAAHDETRRDESDPIVQ